MITTILQQTLTITLFVLGMMVVIEYINVQTRGLWSKNLEKSPLLQIILGALMGIIPGCLGSYTVVSLYIHKVIMFPALVATMIATSGDEAFLMFSTFPGTAFKLNIMLFLIAVLTGFIVHATLKNKFIGLPKHASLPLHSKNDECNKYHPGLILENLKNLSFTRALLLTGILGILFLILSGIIDGSHQLHTLLGGNDPIHHDHDHGSASHHDEANWIKITLLVVLTILSYIFLTVKEHFLQDHLWNHIIKKHFLKIFLWTFAILLAIHLLNQYINLEQWISSNLFLVLILAVIIGIIPESGPHYIFVLLFAQGVLPFSILMASSIVQDGHGTLPLLAESPRAFIVLKIINIIAGLLIGLAGIFLGW